jgi:hypothetical protein
MIRSVVTLSFVLFVTMLWAQPKKSNFALQANYQNYVDCYYNFMAETNGEAFFWNRFSASLGYSFRSNWHYGIGYYYAFSGNHLSPDLSKEGVYAYLGFVGPLYKKFQVQAQTSAGAGRFSTPLFFLGTSPHTLYYFANMRLGASYFVSPKLSIDVFAGALEFEYLQREGFEYLRVKPHLHRASLGIFCYL